MFLEKKSLYRDAKTNSTETFAAAMVENINQNHAL